MNNKNDIPLFQATVGDMAKAMIDSLRQIYQHPELEQSKKPDTERNLVYGIKGLMKLLGCSRAKAQRLKSSGKIDQAIFQDGHTIIIDADLALKLMQEKK